ncbi:MAG: aminotransferase class I/II-fold pyridoxal phosphate-dependent enzyme [Candidatus Atribacteria bacterium]|nr:aminotransferase class I/II-fold pyridoxal phosphate-dependent enzyme [Candidatus Atribacteria bacterium]
MDFSVNLNPWGPPPVLKEHWSDWFRYVSYYPPLDWEFYQKRLSLLYNLNQNLVLPFNGATQAIYFVARRLRTKKIFIIEPCFTEYARAFNLEGKTVVHSHLLFKEGFKNLMTCIKKERPDLIVLGNPSNPLGQCFSNEERLILYYWCHEQKVTLLVDEAFQEFIQEKTSFLPQLLNDDDKTLIIIRSLTKYYSLAGLRGGFIVTNPSSVQEWKQALEPWSINTLFAVTLDLLAGADLHDFHSITLQGLQKEKRYIEESFEKLTKDFELQHSIVNYYTVKIKTNIRSFYSFLQKQRLLVRPLDDFWGMSNDFFRFSVKSHEENKKLMKAMNDYARTL